MKRIATVIAALAATFALGAPAHADAGPVTHHQFNRLQLGEPRAHVQQKLGTTGLRLLADSDRFGQTRIKLYGNGTGGAIVAKYLRPAGSHAFVLISKEFCTSDGTDLTCP